MDWDAAIDRQRTALLRLVTVMFAAVGFEAGGSVEVVSERVRLMVLRLLRPADSVVRRLIFLRARSMPDVEYAPGPKREKTAKRGKGGSRSLAFPLFDPRKRKSKKRRKRPNGPGPRMFFLDGTDPPYTPEPDAPKRGPDDMVSATNLCQRLNALAHALGDLDNQARRLKRAEARRKLSERLSGQGVLRINTPPGHREKGRSDNEIAVDEILSACQTLARLWVKENDTG